MKRKLRACKIATPLGALHIIVSSRGLLSVQFSNGTPLPHVIAGLSATHDVEIVPSDHKMLANATDQFRRYFRGELKRFNLRFDPSGTPFQSRVWNELRSIPYGVTRTYTEIALAVARPGSQRAVGQACRANPLAIVVPCHRVIGKNGHAVGYSGGLEKKLELLDMERLFASRAVNRT